MADEAPSINRLRLMPDQPVEGCELCPDVFLMVSGSAPRGGRSDS